LEFSEKIWKLTNKYPDLESNTFYKRKILTIVLNTILGDYPPDKKATLLRVIQETTKILENNFAFQNATYETLKLEDISRSCQDKKLHDFLKEMFRTILLKMTDKDLLTFFANYDQSTKETTDDELREYSHL